MRTYQEEIIDGIIDGAKKEQNLTVLMNAMLWACKKTKSNTIKASFYYRKCTDLYIDALSALVKNDITQTNALFQQAVEQHAQASEFFEKRGLFLLKTQDTLGVCLPLLKSLKRLFSISNSSRMFTPVSQNSQITRAMTKRMFNVTSDHQKKIKNLYL